MFHSSGGECVWYCKEWYNYGVPSVTSAGLGGLPITVNRSGDRTRGVVIE